VVNTIIKGTNMKKISMFFFMAAVMFLAFSLSAADNRPISDSVAVVTDYSGSCWVKHSGIGSKKRISVNMPVFEGDEFATKKGSFIEITFDDATMVRLDENATMTLNGLRRNNGIAQTVFNLAMGKLFAIVDKLKHPQDKFEVHTKVAIAAVKGTRLGVDGGSDTLGVYEGNVHFTDSSGANGQDVGSGSESSFNGGSKPGKPGPLDSMRSYEQLMAGMGDKLDKLKSMSKDGTLQKFLEGRSKQLGDSSTGDDDHSRLDELKRKLHEELDNTREHSARELKQVTDQVTSDQHEGKALIDVHGNRVRTEDHVYKVYTSLEGGYNAAYELDSLSLTIRDKRLDYLLVQNYFAYDLNQYTSPDMWNFIFPGTAYPVNYRQERTITYSNTVDKVVEDTQYDLYYVDSWMGTSYLPGQEAYALVRNCDTLSVNDKVKEDQIFGGFSQGYPYFSYTMSKNWDDLTDPNPSVGTGYYEDYYYLDNTDILNRLVKHYNDGSTLDYNYYFLNNFGSCTLLAPPERVGSYKYKAMSFDPPYDVLGSDVTNLELQLFSSDFVNGDIDIVSSSLFVPLATNFYDTNDNGRFNVTPYQVP
jgi:hypothetical protein